MPAAPPPSGKQVTVSAAGQELTVVEVGGGIRSYSWGGDPVLDGYEKAEMCSGGRGQVLAPWPNRLGDGRFTWRGRTLQTAITEVESMSAIHGLVRWSSWTVRRAGPAGVVSTHRLHPQPGWPWTLDLRVEYSLSADGLTVTASLANAGPPSGGPCPFGLGFHPYLWAGGGLVDDAELTVPARVGYRSDGRGLPTGRFDVQGTDRDFRTGRLIGEAHVDWCYTDLVRRDDGRAAVRFEPADGRPVELWLDRAWTHVMIYSGDTLPDPSRRRQGLAVEPMTGPPDLLRSGDGRRILEPGETFTAAWGLQVA